MFIMFSPVYVPHTVCTISNLIAALSGIPKCILIINYTGTSVISLAVRVVCQTFTEAVLLHPWFVLLVVKMHGVGS